MLAWWTRQDKAVAGLDLQLRESLTQNLLADLSEGRLDAAIVALPIAEPSLTEILVDDR